MQTTKIPIYQDLELQQGVQKWTAEIERERKQQKLEITKILIGNERVCNNSDWKIKKEWNLQAGEVMSSALKTTVLKFHRLDLS